MDVKINQPESRKKIIYFITKSVWGGAAKYVMDLASGLDANEWRICIAAGGEGPLRARASEEKISWISIHHFGRDIKIIADVASFLEVFRILRREKPDVIHVNSSKAGGIAGLAGYFYNIAARKKMKMIFTVHGWPFMEDRPAWQNFLIGAFTKLTCALYDAVIVISKLDYDISKPNASGKIMLIHNGVDSMSAKFLSKSEARQKLGTPQNAFVIGTIGEWTRNKGWDTLIDAFAPLASRGAILVMIGSGENADKSELLRYIEVNNLRDKITAIPFLENAAAYLNAFDIFAFPSRKEGLPYALLEAGLAELPIVASRAGGNTDIIAHEKTGLIVPPNNPDLLRAAIERLMQNLEEREKFGAAAREKVAREFSLSKMREKTYAVYR